MMVTLYSVRRSKLLLVTVSVRGVVSELVKSKEPLSILVAVPVCVITGVIALRSVPSGRFRKIVLVASSILAYRVLPSLAVTAKEVTRLSGVPVSMRMLHVAPKALYLVP